MVAMASHRDTIVDQFTRQALPFSTAPAIRDEEALRALVEASGAGPEDTVLDVACGPGLVVCAFAPVVAHATGIDVTPAMLDRARAVAAERGATNVTWRLGDVVPLPWPDASFSIVVSRFAFHHFPEPAAVLAEMRRVCRPGGRVVVSDIAAVDPDKAAAFDAMEKLRDPSHVHALTLTELEGLFAAVGLPAPVVHRRRLLVDVEGMLARSFPPEGNAERVRRLFEESIEGDRFGLGVHRHGEGMRFAYPVAVLVAGVG
jgi:SAM-dependent methyltransferase